MEVDLQVINENKNIFNKFEMIQYKDKTKVITRKHARDSQSLQE